MNSKLILSATALAVLSTILALLNTTHLFKPPNNIDWSATANNLQSAEIIHVKGAVGPESVAFDPNGEGPYVGVADGRILKWIDAQNGWVDFAFTTFDRNDCNRPFAPEMEHICGRPLGIRFEKKSGDLYIADAYLGLHVVGPTGGLAVPVVTEVEGSALRFTNDLDIDELEDVIYFTDTSTQFFRRQFINSLLSIDKTGRLMKYDKSTKQVTVLLRGLAFANGVALSKDRSFVLVAETRICKVTRFWLRGPDAGTSDTFADLPGFPDNVRINSKGEFWVALHSKSGILSKWATSIPLLGETLLKLPLSFKQLHYILVGGQAHAVAIKLSDEGKILEVLEDMNGKTLRYISEVEEKDGKLWIGSVLMPFLGVYKLS